MRTREIDWSLYAITPDTTDSESLFESVEEALAAGITVLQVRRKAVSARRMVRETKRILEMARRVRVPVLVNDRLDVALAAGADGVHLGQEDLSLEDALRLVPGEWIVGISTHDAAEAEAAERLGAAYVAVGPVLATPSKRTGPPGGMALVSSVRRVARGPMIAIGGILPNHVREVFMAGADGVAVISGIFGTPAVGENVRRYVEAIRVARESGE